MTRKQYAEKYTTRQTLEGESDKWVEVCAAVKGMLSKQSTVGIGIRVLVNNLEYEKH